ncbi:MAG TPA: undecaprenyl-diphosphate phosphatase [Patescibacteria group bacterium]|nr:undecaprenyl-diphosphate phosphatase [Patescibacteria group bacterium]
MELSHIIILALVQAITEFLPVSSSGHLGLIGFLFGWDYQGVTFDLALHFGTLIAVLAYYRRDLTAIATAMLTRDRSEHGRAQHRLGIGLAISIVPAVIVGLAMGEETATALRMPALIAVNLIAFGVLLGIADRASGKTRGIMSLSLKEALLIGLAQALALIPGTSRSGITMTAGLFLGLDRHEAARYSFLMGVPVTAAACAHGALALYKSGESFVWIDFALGAAIAAIAGIACIHFLLHFLRRLGLMPFVWYRIALGLFVLGLVYLR